MSLSNISIELEDGYKVRVVNSPLYNRLYYSPQKTRKIVRINCGIL